MKTMRTTSILRRVWTFGVALATAASVAACNIEEQKPPSVTGPTEFGLSLTMTASPDTLPRDGQSVTVVTLRARDTTGAPVAGQRVSLTLPVNAPSGAALSQTEVVTDAGGVATFSVTAPISGSLGDIVVQASPVTDGDASNTLARTISITALPANDTAPTVPAFTVNPTSPEIGRGATLTATATDEGVSCTNICTFAWDFDDGTTATGPVVTKTFTQTGTHEVVLTVTDRAGTATVLRQNVTVGAIGFPTASISVSPSTPVAGQEATFTATATATGTHRITNYEWNWGDGTTNSTANPIIRHEYDDPGTYLVTLTVTDDLGQKTTVRQTVTVSSGVTASFTATVVTGTQKVNFDASASSAEGATITSYAWEFGDGATTSGSSPTASRTYASAGIYTVRLTVTDSDGRTGTTTRSVTVP